VAALFQELGVQAIHLETFYDPNELRAAIRGVRLGAPRATLLTSMTVTLGNSGLETPMGTPLAYMAKVMEQEGSDIVGVNCSQTARRMRPSVEALRQAVGFGVPILARPQVGQEGPVCKGSTRPETSEQFMQGILALLDAGADAVGGCCGCRGTHLAAVRQALGPAVQPVLATPEGR
jgi:5-methyltetrahydrofolate--homocysteine methyltransferase